jgi:zinc transport system substrate-binding protein
MLRLRHVGRSAHDTARTVRAMAVGVAVAALAVGCGSPGSSAAGRAGSGGSSGDLKVVTSFYPLQFVASRIGGPDATVTSLTRPGTEPHDLELTPRDVAEVQKADLVVYLSGFQPAVDQSVEQQGADDRAVDVAKTADLHLAEEPHDDDHAGEGATDPHFWLDPTRLANVTEMVADAMAKAEPSGASGFHQRAAALVDELAALDQQYRTGLQHCASTDLVTSHRAFAYLAERYGLRQVGITGVSPESEPDPRSLAQVATFVREHHVTTIYSETLVSPAVARTVARETGATTAVLDPIEGLTDASAGSDYLQVMRSNLEVLRKGQSCT